MPEDALFIQGLILCLPRQNWLSELGELIEMGAEDCELKPGWLRPRSHQDLPLARRIELPCPSSRNGSFPLIGPTPQLVYTRTLTCLSFKAFICYHKPESLLLYIVSRFLWTCHILLCPVFLVLGISPDFYLYLSKILPVL